MYVVNLCRIFNFLKVINGCGVVDFGKVVTMAEIRSVMPAIVLTEEALKHLNKLRADQNKDLCLRVGIRQGVAWECHM
jgi:hypothetical protein